MALIKTINTERKYLRITKVVLHREHVNIYYQIYSVLEDKVTEFGEIDDRCICPDGAETYYSAERPISDDVFCLPEMDTVGMNPFKAAYLKLMENSLFDGWLSDE